MYILGALKVGVLASLDISRYVHMNGYGACVRNPRSSAMIVLSGACFP